jgi:hypothetical protein
VIQSISSVIQALPPDEEIPPIEVRWISFVVLDLVYACFFFFFFV